MKKPHHVENEGTTEEAIYENLFGSDESNDDSDGEDFDKRTLNWGKKSDQEELLPMSYGTNDGLTSSASTKRREQTGSIDCTVDSGKDGNDHMGIVIKGRDNDDEDDGEDDDDDDDDNEVAMGTSVQ